MTCKIEEDGFRFTADQPEVAEGNEQGAPPSTYLAGALAACLAIGYRQCFAAREIPVDCIEVEVTAIMDVCGSFGLDDSELGYDGPVPYAVHVEGTADEDTVQEALDWVDAHNPLTNILRKPVELRRELNLFHTGC